MTMPMLEEVKTDEVRIFFETRAVRARLILLALFLSTASTVASGASIIAFSDPSLGLVSTSQIGSTDRGNLLIEARGIEAIDRIYEKVGGVLFQSEATIGDRSKNSAISLGFRIESESNAVLEVNIGPLHNSSSSPSWIWI